MKANVGAPADLWSGNDADSEGNVSAKNSNRQKLDNMHTAVANLNVNHQYHH